MWQGDQVQTHRDPGTLVLARLGGRKKGGERVKRDQVRRTAVRFYILQPDLSRGLEVGWKIWGGQASAQANRN